MLNRLPEGFKLVKSYSPSEYVLLIDEKILFYDKEYVRKSINQIESEKEWWMSIRYTMKNSITYYMKKDLFKILDNDFYI